MPPRPPPSPGILALLCSAAAAVAVWVGIAADQIARGAVGALLGVPMRGIEVSAAGRWMVVALQSDTRALGPFGFLVMVLSGPAFVAVIAYAVFSLARGMRAAGWLRGLALGLVTVAALWLPAALAAAVLPGGGGPVREVYARLGDPMAGRWTALALGVFALVLSASVVSRCAVAIGRSWMRVDGTEFRRRLVRVTAGWPAATALLLLAFVAGWAPSAWALLFVIGAAAALQFQTR